MLDKIHLSMFYGDDCRSSQFPIEKLVYVPIKRTGKKKTLLLYFVQFGLLLLIRAAGLVIEPPRLRMDLFMYFSPTLND